MKLSNNLGNTPFIITKRGKDFVVVIEAPQQDKLIKEKPMEMCKCGDYKKGLCPKRKCAGFR